jgi:hypothetical protein
MPSTNTKTCSRCHKSKDDSEFGLRAKSDRLLASWCKQCESDYRKQRWSEGKIKNKKKDSRVSRRYALLYSYNLTNEQYDEMLVKQDHRCAVCGIRPFIEKLSVDHDHETGKVRGLLCHKCNVGIGMLRDDPEILNSAIMYLRTNEA